MCNALGVRAGGAEKAVDERLCEVVELEQAELNVAKDCDRSEKLGRRTEAEHA